MYQLGYDGLWREVSQRNPESFTILAPESLQEVCKVFGGHHGIDRKPNFRLVLCESRYQLTGGHQVNIKGVMLPQEVFLPRYAVPKEVHGLYVLEKWNSPEELYKQGYGVNDVEYDNTGKGIRCLEPIWPDGCYEAIWNNPGNPFVFPRNTPRHIIRWAMWLVHLKMSIKAEDERSAKLIQKRKDLERSIKEKNKEDLLYELKQKRRVNLGDPVFGYTANA